MYKPDHKRRNKRRTHRRTFCPGCEYCRENKLHARRKAALAAREAVSEAKNAFLVD